MDAKAIEPGHYPSMTNDEYQGAEAVSKSQLDEVSGSPKHYWERYINPKREVEGKTPALILGDAIHKAVLEPDLFTSMFIARPKDIDARTNAGKAALAALQEEAGTRTILSAADYETARVVRDAVHRHPLAGPLFRGGVAEQSFFARCPRTGALIKCRTDYLKSSHSMIVDLKTTESASPAAFGRSAANYRYDVQAGWYPYVMECLYGEVIEHFVFVAVEKTAPQAIGVYFVEPEDAERGRRLAQRDLDTIIRCREANNWPDFAEMAGPQPLQIPSWARRNI